MERLVETRLANHLNENNILTLEIPRGVNLTPLFFQIFSETPWNFRKKNLGNPRGFNLWPFDGQINVGGSTLPKVMGKIQKALSKIFIDFAIKTY